MGTPQFAVPSLENLVHNQVNVVAVYTQPDKPAGRGRILNPSPAKRAAQALGLPVVQPSSLKEADAVAQLAELHPEVIVVVAFGQILPQAVLDIPNYGCVNIHPSLLPRFRGASPVAAAIMAGDEVTGVSIMLLDAGMDTGPVLLRENVPISPQDTTGSLTEKLSLVAAQLLPDVLARWARGDIFPQPQSEDGATYSAQITKEEGEIDWHISAVDIGRRVRAFNPWPGCYTRWRGRQIKIMQAVPLAGEGVLEVGQVVTLHGKQATFGVCTGGGVLGVLQVQLEGKRPMAADEFLRGQREFIGARLPN